MSAYEAATFRREFEKMSRTLQGNVGAAVDTDYLAWQKGELTTDEFAELLQQHLAIGNAHARGVGDVLASRALLLLHSREVTPTGEPPADVTPESEGQRLGKAVSTLMAGLDEADEFRTRLERLGKSLPVAAMQEQVQASFARADVEGYTRGLDSDPCDLCVWLYKDGAVYPISKPMHQHPGCCCTPIPTN